MELFSSRCSQESCWPAPDGAGLESNVGSMNVYSSGMRQQRADRETALWFLRALGATPISFPARLSTALPNSESFLKRLPSAQSSLQRQMSFGRLVSTWHSNSFDRSEVLRSVRFSIRLISTWIFCESKPKLGDQLDRFPGQVQARKLGGRDDECPVCFGEREQAEALKDAWKVHDCPLVAVRACCEDTVQPALLPRSR